MDKLGIRLLRADEIECRVGTINEKGLSLLLFKDARVDQKILDEVFTPFGWRRTHQEIGGNLYCTVDIWDPGKQQWVSKQDVGTMSFTEKEKGQASDSFKRACFNIGIGRELYTAPFIWVPAEKAKIQTKEGKYYTAEQFSVAEIGYNDNREINRLKICDGHRKAVYAMGISASGKTGGTGGASPAGSETSPSGLGTPPSGAGTSQSDSKTPPSGRQPAKQARDPQKEIRDLMDVRTKEELMRELERTGLELETVLKCYQLKSLSDMTPEIYRNALSGLKKTRSKDAA